MATISNLTLSIVRDVANADITAEWDINWSAFDQASNLPYRESFALIGDDTGEDGDNAPAGDDSISLGLQPVLFFSSEGQATTHRTKTLPTMAFSALNEDSGLFPLVNNDDEIRAVVTYTPQLPVTVRVESGKVEVTSP